MASLAVITQFYWTSLGVNQLDKEKQFRKRSKAFQQAAIFEGWLGDLLVMDQLYFIRTRGRGK